MFPNISEMTKKDLKTLRQAIWQQVFPSLAIVLFLFLVVFIYSSINNNFRWMFIFTTCISIVLGLVIFLVITRKYRMDLKYRGVKFHKEIVEEKMYKLDYEPGSATVPVNFLSLLFFRKIFLREMKEMHLYYIVVQGERIYLDKNDYEKVEKGKPIIIRRLQNSNLFLGVQII